MSASLTPAVIGLVGAVIGATAGLIGALGSQRLQARRARRTALIDSFIAAVGSDPDGGGRTLNLAKAMREAARIGDRTQLRALSSAEDAYEIVHALHSILLDVINAERASGGLESLELDDIHAMFLSEDSYLHQRAWENGEAVPKVEPSQSKSQRPARRRARG